MIFDVFEISHFNPQELPSLLEHGKLTNLLTRIKMLTNTQVKKEFVKELLLNETTSALTNFVFFNHSV